MYSQKGAGGGIPGKSSDPNEAPLEAGSPPGEDEEVTEEEYVPFIIRYSTLIARLFGIVTLTVLWAFTVLTLNDLDNYNNVAPWYLLIISLLMTFFELVWIINKCIRCRKDNCICTFWKLMVWVDNWKKGVLYIVFAIPMFVKNLVIAYTIIAGLLIIILAVLYIIKSFKESKCVARGPRKHSYVQTGSAKPSYVPHPIQTQNGDYPPASHGYNSLGHTNPVQPPEYSSITPRNQPQPQQPQGTNYYRPFKDGMGNVPEEPADATEAQPKKHPEENNNHKQPPKGSQKAKTPVAESSDTVKASPSTESPDVKPESAKTVSSPKDAKEKVQRSPPPEEGKFKLFGLLKKDKPKEQAVAMVSSERGEDEDVDYYPDGKNPFDDNDVSDCEWDPNNRGNN